jgi:putative hydrolase of the HAD superfamily
MPGLRAVLFDFGGTLFSYRSMRGGMGKVILAAVDRLGVDVKPGTALRAYREASYASFQRFFPERYYLHREVFESTFRDLARALGAEPTDEWVAELYVSQRDHVISRFRLRKGCEETLVALRAVGLHVGIVSNIDDDWLLPMLERCGLAQGGLDAWTSSEEARSCKPDARIFHHALEKAGVDPEDVLFVGDSREHDVAGARALGMQTALIEEEGPGPPGTGAGPAPEPHYTIRELGALVAIAGVSR